MNQQQQQEEPTYFDFRWTSFEGDTAEDFQLLKQISNWEDRGIPRCFEIHKCNTKEWTDKLLESILEVFQYFARQGIVWETFHFIDSDGLPKFTPVIILEANKLNLFKCMDLQIYLAEDHERKNLSEDVEFFFPGFNLNQRLESLKIYCANVMTRADSLGLHYLINTTTTLKTLVLRSMEGLDANLLSQALYQNATLEKVTLDFDERSTLSDKEISDIIGGLETLPKLEYLEFAIDTEWGSELGHLASQAFKNLIANSASLSSLEISDYADIECQRNIPCESIFEGLEKSSSLRSLLIRNIFEDEMILSKLISTWSEFSSLEKLSFGGYSDLLSSRRDLARASTMDRMSKPMILELCPLFINEYTWHVEKLLRAHPELMLRGLFFEDFIEKPDSFQHIYSFNLSGGYMLDRPNVVPLSLWPRVLGMANENHDDSASLIFEFLKGPALAKRGNLDFGRYLMHQPKVPLSIWPLVLEKANYSEAAIFDLLKNGPAFAGEGRKMLCDLNRRVN